MVSEPEIEAATKAPKHSVSCAGTGKWAMMSEGPVCVEIFEGDYHDAVKRCAYLDAKAALEAAERARWQPIETAPKDRWILGWWPSSNVRDMAWICIPPNVPGQWTEGTGKPMTPTHWQPLPSPPILHKSDCVTNNAPALPLGPCDLIERATKWAGETAGEYSDEGEKLIIELVAHIKELDDLLNRQKARTEEEAELRGNALNDLDAAKIRIKEFEAECEIQRKGALKAPGMESQ